MTEAVTSPSPTARFAEPAAAGAGFTIRDGVAVAYAHRLRGAAARWHADVAQAFGGAWPAWADAVPMVQAWSDALLSRLVFLSLRTLVLELNVARLQDELAGETAQARFRSFFDNLARPARLDAFLAEYAVLARGIDREIDSARRNGLQALQHLAEDASAIAAGLGFDPRRDRLLSLGAMAGADRHNGGRAVLLATWASGRRLVYKPRPSELDAHFARLLAWIARRDASLRFRQPGVVAARDHGWSEFIEHRPCASAAEAGQFYRREGEALALLHALGACDFHQENLIADGAWPVLVDLEALFHPTLAGAASATAVEHACEALHRTVLRVGLLPLRIAVDAGVPGADIGGMSAPASQLTPMPILVARDAGTDRMAMARMQVRIDADAHRVTLPDGRMPPVVDHVDAVLEGFDRMYSFLLRHRDDLLAPDGPLAAFDRDRARVLVRSTSVYAVLLQEATHPDAQRTHDDARALLARLRVTTDGLPPQQLAALQGLCAAEQRDLAAGDIPIFWARVDATEVQDTGGRRIDGLLAQSARDAVRAVVRGLGPADLALQRWIIRSSLASVSTQRHEGRAARVPHRPARDPAAADPRRDAVRLAGRIGERLGEQAFRGDGGGDAIWLGLNAGQHAQWEVGVLQDDLYAGVAGVVLFLAYLAHATGAAAPRALAESACAGWLARLKERGDAAGAIGAFTGEGGTLYVLTHLAALWRRPGLLVDANRCVARIEAAVARDAQFDVIAGAAGCIAAALGLHQATGSAAALRAATACGDHLLASAVPQSVGWGWPAGAAGEAALGGFSHGAAGIGWALSRLAAATRAPRFESAAAQAFAYDGSLRDGASGGWRDLRPAAAATADEAGYGRWCHGGPGIALARLDSLPVLDDAPMRRDLGAALQSTLRNARGGNHCLCHGELGNLETLLQAERRLPGPGRWSRRVERGLREVVASIEAEGWRCGIALGAESPGLMTGLAGIGYGLLRAAMPDRLPAVLLLEPPRAASS